jgi:hypothetical protein
MEEIKQYLVELGIEGVDVLGTYDDITFVCEDKPTAITVRHSLTHFGDISFAGGAEVRKDGTVALFGRGN